MKKIANLNRKVKVQNGIVVLNKASRVVGIDIGKEKLSCVLMDVNETIMCRFTVEASLSGYKDMLDFRFIEALLGRRSRRFFRGAEIPDGPFRLLLTYPPQCLENRIYKGV